MFRILAAAVVGTVSVLTAALMSASFDGTPTSPLGYQGSAFIEGWSVNVHERSMVFSGTGQPLGDAIHPLEAQHGADCSAPPATHNTGASRSAAVFQCNDHIMMALNGSEYGANYLMPDRLADFSAGSVTVDFDLSTNRMSTRDWWDITISPFMDAQSLPLLSDLSGGCGFGFVDLQGHNRNSVVITTDNGDNVPKLRITRNGVCPEERYGPDFGGTAFDAGIVAGTNQSATRQMHRITLTPTSLRFERLASPTASAVVFIDQTFPALSWNQGVVQIGQHSYSPEKDNAGVPATWHLDNVSINPNVPFYLKNYPTYIGNGGGTLITDPAPAGAFLRFPAVCRVAVNGVFATKMVDGNQPQNASSYLVPIPQGSTSFAISFANDGWYQVGLGCNAKDFDVVSLVGGVPSTPTATASSSPTPPPTSTATSTPTPTATASPAPTATPTAPPTPTPTPQVCRVQVRNSFGNWTYNVGLGSYTGTMVAGECRR